jgi:hypothetical protein
MTWHTQRMALAVTLVAAITGSVLAQESAKGTAPAPLGGQWEGQRHGDGGGSETVTLQFDVQGATFTGTIWRQGHEFGPIIKGKIDGTHVSWETNDIPFTGVITGTSMHIVIHFDNADQELDVAKKDKA